ncbi:MAG TPA: DNA polymerase III subunit gamma/tau [Anaerolineales bacterium]|nr:DNA polymerase III subunit gamma/tau [Anaerolineales bacterium]
MSISLYRKYRPSNWSEVVGQAHVVGTLRNAVTADRIAHAYLFAGPRGTGKTSVARLLAKAANCEHPDPAMRPDDTCENCLSVQNGSFLDLIEIDAASNTSVEDVRDLRDKINFSPNRGRYKVYIVDEVHMLSAAAFNALLKTLEEPPPHAIFILATTEMHKIPATVLSRCQRHEFRRLPLGEMVAQLEMICKQEGIKAERGALELIARQATGSLRDAESLLDQLASTGGGVKLDWAQEVLGTSTSLAVLDLLDALVAKDAAAGLDLIHKTLDIGADPRQFARQVVDALRGLLLLRMGALPGPEHGGEETQRMAKLAKAFSVPDLLRVVRLFHDTTTIEAKTAWLPSLPLDLAFVEAIEVPAGQGQAAPAAQSSQRPAPAPAPKAAPQPAAKQSDAPAASAPASAHLDGQVWTRIKDAVKGRDMNLLALLNSVKTRELRGTVLVLGFASDLLKAKMEKPENMQLFSSILDGALEKNLQVTCMLASGRAGELPADLDSSGMVAAAVRLGGEIVDKTDLGKSE